ncbi:MAG: GHKL domain-containing protein [Eubacteriales bacterium]|nr:GHKL domain-containing protein [Eubacteriales bacterium]
MIWEYTEITITIWAACVLFLFFLERRTYFEIRLLCASVSMTGIVLVGGFLLPAVSGAVLPTGITLMGYLTLCAGFLYACADITVKDAIYGGCWVMITQQIAYEAAYLLFSLIEVNHPVAVVGYTLMVYAVIYGVAAVTILRYMPEEGHYQVGPRQLVSSLVLMGVFEILFEFLQAEPVTGFASIRVWNLLLVQCYCVTILYFQNTMFKKSAMKQELETLNQFWHQQKEQYELSRETIALINHKCHDLKHQIAALRAISSPKEQEAYLHEIEESVQIYDSMVKTGNEVLDTVLTEKSLFCAASQIKINCIADGRRMNVFDPIDLYTIFGNAVDNAVEGVKKLSRQEMRIIDVLVYVRKQFLIINIMNPMERPLEFDREGELPLSTKEKNGYHGFGLRSIRLLVEKYNGFMKIDTENGIFSLKMLIPLDQDGEATTCDRTETT